jgi:hypothetical protein
MLLIIALLIYLLVVICAFLIAYRNGIKKWSALILAILIGWIVLNIITPPHKSLQEFDNSIIPGLYIIIELVTIPVIMVYVIIICLRDK